MQILLRRILTIWSAIVITPIIVGCASTAPGMHMDTRYTDSSLSLAAEPEVKTITPQLVLTEKKQREQKTGQDISLLIAPPTPYKIGSGDILSIVVWDHPELAGSGTTSLAPSGTDSSNLAGFVVDHKGLLQFPYIGSIKLAGLTEEQARTALATKLAHYINKPNITLRIQAYRSKRIYIDGEVKSPGLQAINDIPMTLMEALNRAGGLLPSADQSQIIINRAGKSYQINLPQLVQKNINPASIMLLHGDVIRVLARDESKVFVSGEVTVPRALTMHNGRLTLNEALGESGGINPLSGDGGQVYVVRKMANDSVVYRLDASSPGAMAMAEDFELNPKDVVYVAATALANWHRSISLILPGALSSAVSTVHTPTR